MTLLYQGLAEPVLPPSGSTVTPVALVTLWDGIRPIPQTALTASTAPLLPQPNTTVPTWFLGQQVTPPIRPVTYPSGVVQNVSPLAAPVDPAGFIGPPHIAIIPVPERRLPGWFTAGLAVSLVRLDVPTQQWPIPQWPTFRPRPDTVAPILLPTVPFNPAQQVATLPQPQQAPAPRWIISTLSQPPSITVQAPPLLSWKPTLRETPLPLPTRPTAIPYFTFYPVPITPAAAPAMSWQPRLDMPTRDRVSVAAQTQGMIAPFPISVPAYLFTMWKSYLPDFALGRGLHPSQMPSNANPSWSDIATVSFATWKPILPDWLVRLLPAPTPASVVVPLPSVIASGVGCIMVADPGVTQSTLAASTTTDSTLDAPQLTVTTLADPEVC